MRKNLKEIKVIYKTNHFRGMLKPMAILFLFLVLMATTLTSIGANWYVAKTGINAAGHGTTVGDPFLTINYAITAASAGDVINVASGTYSEYMSITKALTINGANANIAGNATRGAESKVQDLSGYSVFSIKSDGVTINGFEVTAPLSNSAIYIGDGSGNYNYSNVNVQFNYIHDVGTQRGSGNVYAINYYVPNIAATTTNINISDNRVDIIGNSGGTYTLAGHCGGIYFANSTSTGTVNNVTIMRNVVTNIKSSAFGKSTWGIVIGTSGTGKLVNPIISYNEISNLVSASGSYSHAIGLEGNTPGASVQNNKISLTTSQYAVYVSSNTGTGIVVNNNSFTNISKGIYNATTKSIDGSCNWWGQTASISSKISGTVTYTPWLTNGTDNDLNATGFQPTATCLSPCNLVIATSFTPACTATSNGTASVSITSGGSGSYSYVWKQGSTTIGTTATITGLSAATFTIAVTDLNGCTASGSAVVTTSALPTANITGGTNNSVSIALTGTAPWNGTFSDGTPFSGSINPLTVNVSPAATTTYTVATLTDANCTAIAGGLTGSYTINMKVETPLISLTPGTYTNPQSVTLTCPTSGATIRYSTDGSNPNELNGTTYTGVFNILSTATLKVIAYKSPMLESDIAEASYIINIDTDADGVLDGDDTYPNDPNRAFDNFYPATGNGTLVFEDSWPARGDYDLNDVVVDYRFKNILNASNMLVETYATFTLKATGASFENGFGFQFASNDILPSALQVTGFNIHESYLMLNANGTESNQNKPTIIVFDNAYAVFNTSIPGSTGFNTTPGALYVTPVTITIHIIYTPNTFTLQQLDIAHFNPFIFINKERGKEVHLPDFAPTSLANATTLGTIDDNSIPAQNRYYKTKNNLPWALNLYNNFSYPNEKTEVTKAYLHFIDWVISNGTSYTDWYTNTATGYRNNSNIYSSGKK